MTGLYRAVDASCTSRAHSESNSDLSNGEGEVTHPHPSYYSQLVSRTLLWILPRLPAPGALLLGLGITGDILNWWDDLGYVSNILAGTTGACFGIPLAFYGIQKILRIEDERRELHNLTEDAARQLRDLIRICESTLRLSRVSEMIRLAARASSALDWVRIKAAEDLNSLSKIELLVDLADEAVETLGLYVGQENGAEKALLRSQRWLIAQDRWESLSKDVLPRLRASSLPTFDEFIEAELHVMFERAEASSRDSIYVSGTLSNFKPSAVISFALEATENGGKLARLRGLERLNEFLIVWRAEWETYEKSLESLRELLEELDPDF